MTELLQQAMAKAETLPPQDQDAIATRWLSEIDDEQLWSEKFAATSDVQWDRMAEHVRGEIEAGKAHSLDEVFPSEESSK